MEAIQKLAQNIRIDFRTNCVLWMGGKTLTGYGGFKIGKLRFSAHRTSYEAHFGPIPKGLNVCHTCDRPSCVNPQHLFLGTPKDNMRDCAIKGRNFRPKGEKNPTAKLDSKKILSIRNDIRSCATIGTAYGISRKTVEKIKRKDCWKHVL